ncbi:Aurora kinase B [Tetrabaena socialis]|uniref:Aurora kinase B n=1 Tax=Tetrabaena socialis TaxID=47790 RepID=A0A2J8ABN1_9CHLO|nr:Aurora kinase B [Tetrabaena socialis]|eukprot:PNH09883.1 Aurora kinase B [Tetrabaena socialis]
MMQGSIKDFVLVKEVGSGAASTVYYAICRKSTQPVAIKMYLKAKLSKLNRRQVEREINIHSSLNHPHIIDFYAAFEDDERIYLVQEYAAGGDLFDDVKRRGGRVPEREVVHQVLHPYLMALAYLHARGIIHRQEAREGGQGVRQACCPDIKPENTVFTRERVMKVTDFGLAIHADTERPVTRLGTLDYMAPEQMHPDERVTAAGAAAAAAGASAGGGGSATHAPSPLGRDQPHQQARAAAIQQHMRSRSLNRFHAEQMHLATAGAAVAAPATIVPPPGVPYAVSLQAAGISGMPYAVPLYQAPGGGGGGGAVGNSVAAGTDGAVAAAAAAAGVPGSTSSRGSVPTATSVGGAGGGNVCDNRFAHHVSAASPRPPSMHPGQSHSRPHGSPAQQYGHPPYGHQPHYGGGVSYSGGCAPAVPSPLGLRSSSASRPSTASGSSDASNCSLIATPHGGADGMLLQQ